MAGNQTQNISIPINSKLDLSNYDHQVHALDKPAFNKKSSITWQNVVQNPHINRDTGFLTTGGKPLKKRQLKDDHGDNIGTTLVDAQGKEYFFKHKWLLTKSDKLPQLTGGKEIAASLWKDRLYVLYQNENVWSVVVVDYETFDIIDQIQLPDIKSATISSVNELDQCPVLFTLTQINLYGINYQNICNAYRLEDLNHELNKAFISFDSTSGRNKDFTPWGFKMTATITRFEGDVGYFVGFEDLDANRNRTLIWTDKSIADIHAYPNSMPKDHYRWFGCVAPNGTITGEPIPKAQDDKLDFTEVRASNGVYMWDTWPGGKKVAYNIIAGYKLEKTLNFKLEPITIYKCDNKHWARVNMSVNDKAEADATGELEKIDPKRFFVTNYADSRGVYFDWGTGWIRSYIRVLDYSSKITKCEIYTYGRKQLETNSLESHESIMARGKVKEWDYNEGKLNQRVYTVGGNNKAEKSILGEVPFTVQLLNKNAEEDELLNIQMWQLLDVSYSFNKTLITTPSEGQGSNLTIRWSKNRDWLFFFKDGSFYEIEKTSNCDKFRLDKIADYAFRANVLDADNALKEDRQGNITVTRGFIPYNMECILDVDDLRVMPAPKTEIDANNGWFEGVGYNVNLDVDNIAMSFLLPKIQLSLYISSNDLDAFAIGAIDQRGSILKPIFKNIFDDYDKIDVFYTLQSHSTDCTYKMTQVVKKNDAAVERWDIYGKDTYDILKKGTSWWVDAANTVIFPIGAGSRINGINFITPTVQLAGNYASRLYTFSNQLFLGFNYSSQVWHGSNIFTIYGSNYYYDGQGIYYVGTDNDFSNNSFVCYALGMQFLANSGSEGYFYSDFEKRLFVFTGSNTLQPADLLSSVGNIKDALFSSKEQCLYLLTEDQKLIVRTQTDIAMMEDLPKKTHLEGTTAGAAIVSGEDYFIYSPWQGKEILPLDLETEALGGFENLAKCAYVDVLLYRLKDNVNLTVDVFVVNGIDKNVEKKSYSLSSKDWKSTGYRLRITPRNNVGNAFSVKIHSDDLVGVQGIVFAMTRLGNGLGADNRANTTYIGGMK